MRFVTLSAGLYPARVSLGKINRIRWVFCLLLAHLSLAVVTPGECGATLINTGLDAATSTRLPNDAYDANWTFVAAPDASFVGGSPVVRVFPLAGGWLADNASTLSRWIVAGRPGDSTLNDAPGLWTLQTSVSLDSADANTQITGLQYAADNKLVSLTINGTTVFSQDAAFAQEFQVWHTIGDVGAGLFHPGANVLQFTLANQEGLNTPLGLRVEGTVVPEPAAIALIGILVVPFWRNPKRGSHD